MEYPIAFGDLLEFLGYEVIQTGADDNRELLVLTYWRIKEPTELPLAFFLHLLDPEGNIVAQYDGLAALPDTWQAGDLLLQLHPLTLPEDGAQARDWLQLGIYDTKTLERITIAGDALPHQQRVLLPLKPLE